MSPTRPDSTGSDPALAPVLNELKKIGFGVSPLERGGLDATAMDLGTATDTLGLLSSFLSKPSAEGWITFASANVLVKTDESLPTDQGAPLSAEIAAGKDSLHVRQTSEGRWIVATFSRNDGAAGYLVERCYRGRAAATGRTLKYELWWTTEEGVLLPRACRFAGFVSRVKGSL